MSACQHQAAYSETGRTIGGHRELQCANCLERFVSTLTFGVGRIEDAHRTLALVHFPDKVRAWNIDVLPLRRVAASCYDFPLADGSEDLGR